MTALASATGAIPVLLLNFTKPAPWVDFLASYNALFKPASP